jgi:hypothetical protein
VCACACACVCVCVCVCVFLCLPDPSLYVTVPRPTPLQGTDAEQAWIRRRIVDKLHTRPRLGGTLTQFNDLIARGPRYLYCTHRRKNASDEEGTVKIVLHSHSRQVLVERFRLDGDCVESVCAKWSSARQSLFATSAEAPVAADDADHVTCRIALRDLFASAVLGRYGSFLCVRNSDGAWRPQKVTASCTRAVELGYDVSRTWFSWCVRSTSHATCALCATDSDDAPSALTLLRSHPSGACMEALCVCLEG